MNKLEVFNDEIQVLRHIDQLRIKDVKDEDITVVYKDGFRRHTLRYPHVNFKKANGTLWDRLVAKVGDQNSEARVFNELNLTEEEVNKYQDTVDNGAFLLFVSGASLEALDTAEDTQQHETTEEESVENDSNHFENKEEQTGQPRETAIPLSEEPEAKSFETENTEQSVSENDTDDVIDMSRYEPTTEPLEVAGDDDNNDDDDNKTADDVSDNQTEEETTEETKSVKDIPEERDYTVKDNVVNLGDR